MALQARVRFAGRMNVSLNLPVPVIGVSWGNAVRARLRGTPAWAS